MPTINILDLNNRVGALEKKEDQDTTDYEKLSNLPKINTVELKGSKTSSDLGLAGAADIAAEFNTETTYTKGVMVYHEGKLYQFDEDHTAGAWIGTDAHETNVSDAILESGGGGGQKTYGTAVDITTATQSNPYTCPSDGVVNLQSGYASGNYTALFKVGWTGFMAIAKGNENQANGAMTVPVLKGDQLYVQYSGTPTANYYPYE